MHTILRALATLAIGSLAIATPGCGLYEVVNAHAEPCGIQEEAGWKATQYGSVQRQFGHYLINVSTKHISSATDSGLHIALYANSVPQDASQPTILFSPTGAFVEIGGERVQAVNSSHESKFKPTGPVCDPSKCLTAFMSFETYKSIEQGFELRLSALQIGGVSSEVPPIRFCYVPSKIISVPFHI